MSVSICIPAHNAALTIADTLRSVLNQTYDVEDIVIVDNASTDSTAKIVLNFAKDNKRIRYLRFEELVSSHENFTRCFLAARGDLMAIFHADDIYHPTVIEEEVSLLRKHKDIGAVFAKGRRIDRDNVPLREPFPIPSSIFIGDLAQFDFLAAFQAVLQYGNIFLTPSAMVRTHIYLNEVRQWPYPDFGGSADLFVFLTIALRHKIAILNQSLIDYRASESSASYIYARKRRSKHDIFKVLEYFMNTEVSAVLQPRDHANYRFLILKDDINIAISCMIDSDRSPARNLMPRLLQPTIIAAAFRYRRHAKFLVFGYCTWLLSFVRLGRTGRRTLKKLRFG